MLGFKIITIEGLFHILKAQLQGREHLSFPNYCIPYIKMNWKAGILTFFLQSFWHDLVTPVLLHMTVLSRAAYLGL